MAENFTHITYHDELERRIKSSEVNPEKLIEILKEAEEFGLMDYDNARHISRVFKMIFPYDHFIGNVELVDYLFKLLDRVYLTSYFNNMKKDIYYKFCSNATLTETTMRRIFSMSDFLNMRAFNAMVVNPNISKDTLFTVFVAILDGNVSRRIEDYLPWMKIFYEKVKDITVKERARIYFFELIPDDEFLSTEVKDLFLF